MKSQSSHFDYKVSSAFPFWRSRLLQRSPDTVHVVVVIERLQEFANLCAL